jgi:hypothetical protein
MMRTTTIGLAAMAALALTGDPVRAAQQTVAGKKILIGNTAAGDASRRKVVYLAKELGSDETLGGAAGDPTVGGAKLKVLLGSGAQCFTMPASAWSAFHLRGGATAFKYRDSAGTLGPVKVALMKKTAGSLFMIKALMLGRLGPGPQPHIVVIPPGPEANTNFKIGGGDEYCSKFGGTISRNDTKVFKAKDSPDPGPPCGATACSPSGAFLDGASGLLQ